MFEDRGGGFAVFEVYEQSAALRDSGQGHFYCQLGQVRQLPQAANHSARSVFKDHPR